MGVEPVAIRATDVSRRSSTDDDDLDLDLDLDLVGDPVAWRGVP